MGRLIPVVRAFISVPTGLAVMKRGRYIVLAAIGSAIWVFLPTELGYRAGQNQHFVRYFREAQYPIIALVVLALAAGVWHLWHSLNDAPRRAHSS